MDAPHSKITKDLGEAFLKDPRTKGCTIDIGYNRGIVTLTGNVKTENARRAAEEIARSQPDVLQVVNELRVR